MKTSCILILAALLMSIGSELAVGQDSAGIEALQIDGPHEALTGTLVRLSANTVEEETPLWIVLDPIDLDYELTCGGKRLLFSTGCKEGQRITVLLLAQQMRDDRLVTRQIRRVLKVVSEKTTDEPRECPPHVPPDEPSLTDSPLYLPVMKVWHLIRTDDGKALSEEVAANIDAIARKCDAGAVSKNSEIWSQLSKSNRETLGVESAAWNPVAELMQAEFQRLQLQTPAEHSFHLKATAAAIRAAFKQTPDSRNLK